MTTKRKPKAWKPPAKTRALMLRTCGPGMTAHGGFIWPRSGYVEAPDWNPAAHCGNGLHGLLWGAGDASLLTRDAADWLVVEIDGAEAVELSGKVKVPRGNVVFVGSRVDAVARIQAAAPAGTAVVFGTATSGDRGTSTSGYRGTSTSGDGGTSTSGDMGTSTSGYRGTSTSGDGGTSTSGDRGTATSGDRGTSTSGYRGTSTSGDGGTSTSGDMGTSTSGYMGTSTSGYRGTSTSGDMGTSTSGLYGVIAIEWYDGSNWRKAIAEVDGVNIKANVKYRCKNGRFVEVA